MADNKFVDPTACGLFFVAVISLPLCLYNLLDEASDMGAFFKVMGISLLVIALIAWYCGSNFGFTVFGLVGAGVALCGFGMGKYECVAFALFYFFAIAWSVLVKTPKALTIILLTTGLIFLASGLAGIVEGDYWRWIIGAAALGNFIFSLYLSIALVSDGKVPVF